MSLAKLNTEGVCVLPITASAHLSSKVSTIISEIKEVKDPQSALLDLPYPISNEHPCRLVLGGFGATGLPSLSHHPEVRAIRASVFDQLLPEWIEFAKAFPEKNLHIELLFDRFSIRRKGTSTSSESWHRDVGPKAAGDTIYGGWFNLDPIGSPPQQFSCVPGNVLPSDVDPLGFAKFKPEEIPALNKAFKGPIEVPPGHIIIFDQTIAHKITGATAPATSYRLYFGWRLTESSTCLYDKNSIIARQSMPPLPSGQEAPMYAKRHLINWRDRLIDFSSQFKPEFLDPKTASGRPLVARVLPGLIETGLAFPAYSEEESRLLYPRRLLDDKMGGGGACEREDDEKDEEGNEEKEAEVKTEKHQPKKRRC